MNSSLTLAILFLVGCVFASPHLNTMREKPENQRNCKNLPGFKDKWGTTCERTMEDGNCKNGKPWGIPAEELGQKDANSDGVSVLDACCGCGGGTYEGYSFMTGKYCSGSYINGDYKKESLDAAINECNKIFSCGCIGLWQGDYYLRQFVKSFNSPGDKIWVKQ